jgi:hypothetical protein
MQKNIDHEPRKIRWAWLWGKLEKISRFVKLENVCNIFRNSLAFVRQTEMAI